MRTFAISAVILAATATPALADWQNTTWRMTQSQVVAATGAKPVRGDAGQRVFNADLGAEGTYSALGFDFQSQFFFSAGNQLRVVKLTLADAARCDELEEAVAGIYGAPLSRSSLGARWQDGRSGDIVHFTDLRGPLSEGCFLAYRPSAPGGSSGL